MIAEPPNNVQASRWREHPLMRAASLFLPLLWDSAPALSDGACLYLIRLLQRTKNAAKKASSVSAGPSSTFEGTFKERSVY